MVQWRETTAIASAHAVQVSPRGFKSNLAIVIEALIQHRLPATILGKLPRGSSWVDELRQYSRALPSPPPIYLLSRSQPRLADWFTPVLIPAEYPMQGEYGLIIVASTVSILLMGERLEVNSPTDGSNIVHGVEPSEETDSLPKVDFNFSLSRSVIQQKLREWRQVFEASLQAYPDNAALAECLGQWDASLQVSDGTDAELLNTIFLHHADHQERIRQQARQYRRQAMTASTLTTQNEALINTLRLKDDFLNTVGQELRTPLSTIKTALPLLASPNLKPPQRQRYLDMISRECDRQSSLINGVLDLLQLERSLSTAVPDPIKLFDIVPGIVSTFQPIAQEKGIRLAYTVPNNLSAVSCPEGWIRQIVIHLLSNSIRYTEAGGEVWVTVQEEDEDKLILNVRDTGIGIPQNELPHIFDHFYRGRQASQDEEGAGLGLTIVQQLLLYCGGQITVDSQPNVGTHFRVRLPIHHN